MRREEVLEYETRRRIYGTIRAEPGLHLREMERRLDIPLSTLRHHLRYLERHRLVEPQEDKNVQRWFPTVLVDDLDRRTIGALRQESLRRVLLFMLSRPDAVVGYQDILASLGIPPSTLALYLAQLTKRGLLRRVTIGRESRYEVISPERVVRLLHAYRGSFLDALVDHLLDVVYQDEPPRR